MRTSRCAEPPANYSQLLDNDIGSHYQPWQGPPPMGRSVEDKLPEPHTLSLLSIPTDLLVALDHRPYRFFLQPYHHLVRMLHILSVSAFFGAIVLLDMRLAGFRAVVALKDLSGAVMSWIYATFGIGVVTGVMLFFYDPVHVASHAYF